jgi:hypothetical protein
MATTIDHLSNDHRVTILRDFTDAAGTTLKAGASGVLRNQSFDQIRLEIRIEIEREKEKITLKFPLKAVEGPRIGHMKDFFELGDYVPVPGSERLRPPLLTKNVVVPVPEQPPVKNSGLDWWRQARNTEGPDRLEAAEEQIMREAQHLGGAGSIAEMYAQRMRAFRSAGNEPRAVAAFKLAAQWIQTYAGYATSGGEGAALSLERDQFHAALVREFGYDPTEGSR